MVKKTFTLGVKGFSVCHPFLGGWPPRPLWTNFCSVTIFLIFLSRILRNFSAFEFLQIQIVGEETVIVVMLRHFSQNLQRNGGGNDSLAAAQWRRQLGGGGSMAAVAASSSGGSLAAAQRQRR